MLANSIGVIKQANPQILRVLKQDSEILARIQDSFHTMIRSRNTDEFQPIEITCFYEELPLLGIGLVNKVMCFTWSSHNNLCILGRSS
jgi:protein SERAC1